MSEADVTLEGFKEAAEYLQSVAEFRRTPLLIDAQDSLGISKTLKCSIYLKLEAMQTTGSFKFRGAANQMHKALPSLKPGDRVVTFSGGNFGKAFATVTQRLGLPTVIVMPNSVPKERITLIQSLGAQVDLQDICDLNKRVAEHAQNGLKVFHPYDDLNLVLGYGSVGFELIEQIGTEPDVILVPCGGGGLVSGMAAAIRLAGNEKAKIYAVEPATAPTMYNSFRIGHPATVPTAQSVATGLCPPNAGTINYALCRKYVSDVLLVEEQEIVDATKTLIKAGFIVEPSGAAALAALLYNKIPCDVTGKKVAILITGRNIAPETVLQFSYDK